MRPASAAVLVLVIIGTIALALKLTGVIGDMLGSWVMWACIVGAAAVNIGAVLKREGGRGRHREPRFANK